MGDAESSVSIPPTYSSAPVPSPTQVPVRPSIATGVKLDAAAVAEAQQRDNTATRSFTSAAIKVSAAKAHTT